MRIFLNGDARDIEPATLDVALGLLGFRDAVVATALNGRFVAKGARPATALAEGDVIEVVAPLQGG
jgi:sulfur carrier protein